MGAKTTDTRKRWAVLRLAWFEAWADGSHRPDCTFFGSFANARDYAVDQARGGSPYIIMESTWVVRRSNPPPTPPVELVRCE